MTKSQLGFLDHPDPDYWKGSSYAFYDKGVWDQDEIDRIDLTLTDAIGDVGRGYNAWVFSKHQWGMEPVEYSVGRYTWEYGHWRSTRLDELLDTIWCESVRIIAAIPSAAEVITVDDVRNTPVAWYLDDDERFKEYYGAMSCIWYLDWPHVKALFFTYDQNVSNTSQCFSQVKYIQPRDRGK